jgi:hypothetical protein
MGGAYLQICTSAHHCLLILAPYFSQPGEARSIALRLLPSRWARFLFVNNPKAAVAGLKMPHPQEITLAFEFSVLTLTVPRLRAKNFRILRAFAYLRHFHSP